MQVVKRQKNLNSQGKVYEQDYRFKKAIKLYSEAIEMEPNNADFYLDRGLLFLKLERPVEAKSDLSKVVSLELQNVKGWQAMAEYFLYKEVPDSAIFASTDQLALTGTIRTNEET